jgi:hypothetical protein
MLDDAHHLLGGEAATDLEVVLASWPLQGLESY